MWQKRNVKHICVLWQKFFKERCWRKLIQMALDAVEISQVVFLNRFLRLCWRQRSDVLRYFQEFKGEKAKKLSFDQLLDEDLNLDGRLHGVGRIVVASDGFIFVCNFIKTGNKFPLEIRLNLNDKAMVLEVRLKIIDGGFYDSTICQKMIQKLFLRSVHFFVDRDDPFLFECYQTFVKFWVNFLFQTFLFGISEQSC